MDIIELRTPSRRFYPITGTSLVYEFTIGTSTAEFLNDQIYILDLEIESILNTLKETSVVDLSTIYPPNNGAIYDFLNHCNQKGTDRETQLLHELIKRNDSMNTQLISINNEITSMDQLSANILKNTTNITDQPIIDELQCLSATAYGMKNSQQSIQ